MMRDEIKEKERLLTEVEELRTKVAELEMGEGERKKALEEFNAANQQLMATEQQLKAANQQLEASNQQLMTNELMIKASEERWRSMTENSPDHIMTIDLDYNILYINRTIPPMTKEEMIGKSVLIFVPEKFQESAKQCYDHVKETSEIQTYYTDFTDSDGVAHYFEVRVVPIQVSGNTTSLLLTGTDITERKQGEEKLRATNQQLEASNQQLRATEQQLEASNQQLEATNQQLRASEEVIKKHAHDMGERVKELSCVYGVADSIRIRERLEEIFQDVVELIPPSWHYPEIARGKIRFDGKEYVSEQFEETQWNQSSDIIVNGEPRGSIEVYYLQKRPELDEGPFMKEERNLINEMARKISLTIERKKSVEALRESEFRFKTIFNNATDGILLADIESRRFYAANDMFCQMLGYDLEEIKSLEVMDIHPVKDLPYVSEQFEKQSRKEIELAEDIPVKRKDGSVFYADVNSSPITLSGKTYLMGIFRDITERKLAEEERERLLEVLEEKSEELQQIIYVTSHDLRSPMVNIQGFAQELDSCLKEISKTLASEGISQELKEEVGSIIEDDMPEAIHYILASIDKMDSLIKGLLRISRLGTAALSFKELDMNKLLDEVRGTMEHSIQEKGVKLVIEDIPNSIGDETQINQVFSNLIDNALKYLDPERPGEIKISGEVVNGKVRYLVEDNGIGIQPEHMEKVFQVFHRIDKEKTKGEGLGLTAVRRILDRHNGRIWVESEFGKGSTFYVSLPLPYGNSEKPEAV